jgi:hypothetical protein
MDMGKEWDAASSTGPTHRKVAARESEEQTASTSFSKRKHILRVVFQFNIILPSISEST